MAMLLIATLPLAHARATVRYLERCKQVCRMTRSPSQVELLVPRTMVRSDAKLRFAQVCGVGVSEIEVKSVNRYPHWRAAADAIDTAPVQHL